MTHPTRRTFLGTAGLGMAALAAAAPTRKAAASERVRHAVIGMGSQGQRHAAVFDGFEDCDVVAVCDVDPKRREEARGKLSKPEQVRAIEHFREILDDDAIDSVSITTPDHWHTPIALHALNAGKHVYVEKPCCHNIHEGEVLARAAMDTGLCVQHGTQARSSKGIQDAMQFLREGNLGKIRMAKTINHQLRPPIGKAPVEEPPPGVDYDLWLGPAPKHPFTRNRWHYNWHWFWDYGGGDIVNDGIHHLDQARWGLGVGKPKAISASGGQLFYNDDHQTPDYQVVTFEYDDCCLIYEMRLWTQYPLEGMNNGAVFYGDEGTLHSGSEVIVQRLGEAPEKFGPGADFAANPRNFLDAIKANDPSLLHAPIDEGMISANCCNAGNIATRVGRRLVLEDDAWRFNDDEANALVKRAYREGYELRKV